MFHRKFIGICLPVVLCLLYICCFFQHVSGSNPCNNVAHTFYRKMKCSPEMSPGSSCPASYKCDQLAKRSLEKCYLAGQEYEVGSSVTRDKVDFETPCVESCTCAKHANGSRFSCELGRGLTECEPLPQECRRHMFEESFSCCRKSFVTCDKVSDPTQRRDVKCVYNNKTFNEGERFFPTSDVTCTQCICAEGFNGSIASPYCAPTDCPLELWGDSPHHLTQGCIPVYLSAQGCCPVMFRCPNSTDSVIQTEKTQNKNGLSCSFGSLKLAVGDQLSPWWRMRDAECRCDIPPLPVCVKTSLVLTAEIISLINHDHQHHH